MAEKVSLLKYTSPEPFEGGSSPDYQCVCVSVCLCASLAPLKRVYLRNKLRYNNETWILGPIDFVKFLCASMFGLCVTCKAQNGSKG